MREPYPNELYHYGVKGMKWGVIRSISDYISQRKKARAKKQQDEQMMAIRKQDASAPKRKAIDASVHLRAQGERSAKDAALLGASRASQSPQALEQYYDWIRTKLGACASVMRSADIVARIYEGYNNGSSKKTLSTRKRADLISALYALGLTDEANLIRNAKYDNELIDLKNAIISKARQLSSLAYEDYRGYEEGMDKVSNAAKKFSGKFDNGKKMAAEHELKMCSYGKPQAGYDLDDNSFNQRNRRRRGR